MAEKVKVSREVAEAIEELYVEYGGKTPDRIEVITYDIIHVVEMRKVFGSMRLQDVIKAISDGYEIRKAPEDKISETYQSFCRNASKYDTGFNDGIRYALNTLDIKIKGVNE